MTHDCWSLEASLSPKLAAGSLVFHEPFREIDVVWKSRSMLGSGTVRICSFRIGSVPYVDAEDVAVTVNPKPPNVVARLGTVEPVRCDSYGRLETLESCFCGRAKGAVLCDALAVVALMIEGVLQHADTGARGASSHRALAIAVVCRHHDGVVSAGVDISAPVARTDGFSRARADSDARCGEHRACNCGGQKATRHGGEPFEIACLILATH
jgi:hypothetical protein